jgi:hypothetical protein
LLWDDETGTLPPGEWLVDRLFPYGGLSVVVAPKESGKTVMLVGTALSIGAGLPVFGRPVKQGVVVYIYAEGQSGLHRRVEAFKEAHGLSGRCNVLFLPSRVQLLQPEQVEAFTQSIEDALPPYELPVAIIVDTISRCTPGGDENSKADQSRIVWAADMWKERFGCAVILVGHPPKSRSNGLKGSEDIENSADSVIRLERDGHAVTFHSEKDRDGEHFSPFTLEITPCAKSVILTELDASAQSSRLTRLQLQALQCLADISESLGCSTSRWERACTQGGVMASRTFWGARKRLLTDGYVMQVRGGKDCAVSPKGYDLLQLQHPRNSTAIAVAPTAASAAPSFRRGSSAGQAVAADVGHQSDFSEDVLEREAIELEGARGASIQIPSKLERRPRRAAS